MDFQKKMLFLKTTCLLGIAADALWTVGLLVPGIFGLLTGNIDFDPDLQVRLILGIGASLMMGWTFLLVWLYHKPVERRCVFILTAFPVVLGMLVVSIMGYIDGGKTNIWLIIKTLVLMTTMSTSYVLAGTMAKDEY